MNKFTLGTSGHKRSLDCGIFMFFVAALSALENLEKLFLRNEASVYRYHFGIPSRGLWMV